MKFAYADPPYLGLARIYAKRHPEAMVWDNPSTHEQLIDRLCSEYADGWALSLHLPSIRTILPMCPSQARIAAWVKPFASFKPGVNPGYTWEPVIFCGGRKRMRGEATVRDHFACPISLMKGLPGAKPREFCRWIIEILNALPGDEFDDLFPGTGIFGRVWAERQTDFFENHRAAQAKFAEVA